MISPMGRGTIRAKNSTINVSIVPEKRKFRNRQELEKYYIEVEGREALDTFLVPDMEDIKNILARK